MESTFHLNHYMMSSFADGEFWSKKSTTPSGMYVACFKSNSNVSLSKSCNGDEIPFIITFSDSKLHKEVSLTLNKPGTKERTYAKKYYGELGSIVLYFWQNLDININKRKQLKQASQEQSKNMGSIPEEY